MRKGLSNKALAVALGIGWSLGLTPAAQAAALEIHAHRQDQLLTCVKLSNDLFALSFIHSVSRTPVRDEYRIIEDEGRFSIIQTAEKFIAHGQGLPSMQGEPDATEFVHENGQFILKLNRPIKRLIVRTDPRYKNRLDSGNAEKDMNQWGDTALWLKPVQSCAISR